MTIVKPGDRFVQQLPYGRDTLTVEHYVGPGQVAVRRASGARQVFPVSTLLTPHYWARAETAAKSKERTP